MLREVRDIIFMALLRINKEELKELKRAAMTVQVLSEGWSYPLKVM